MAALDLVGRLVGAVGRVLPASTGRSRSCAQVSGLDPRRPRGGARGRRAGRRGHARPAGPSGTPAPADPPACEEAVAAVLEADWVVLGPGSWFTSVLTHLLVPGLREALAPRAPGAWSRSTCGAGGGDLRVHPGGAPRRAHRARARRALRRRARRPRRRRGPGRARARRRPGRRPPRARAPSPPPTARPATTSTASRPRAPHPSLTAPV